MTEGSIASPTSSVDKYRARTAPESSTCLWSSRLSGLGVSNARLVGSPCGQHTTVESLEQRVDGLVVRVSPQGLKRCFAPKRPERCPPLRCLNGVSAIPTDSFGAASPHSECRPWVVAGTHELRLTGSPSLAIGLSGSGHR